MNQLISATLLFCAAALPGFAGNPLVSTVYSADPSGHVWPGDDRLWIYASHDQPGTNTHDTMISYHVFSTRDMVNWNDYGVVLHLKDVSWAISHMWAIDCILRKGTYYLVYCAKEKGTGIYRTGLATSQLPQGPFKDIGFIKGVEQGQDPAVFEDEDGKTYLYWGSGGTCHAAQLTDDLLSVVPGTIVDLTSQLTNVFEGPWVHKYKGKYYLSYPGLIYGKWPENMFYAIADKPLGPYHFMGAYIPEFKGQAGTNHGSIVEYKGRWYALHHSMWVSGGLSEVRNLMCDYLEYNEDGSIKPIVPTREGVVAGDAKPGPSRVTLVLEAENAVPGCGELRETHVASRVPGYSGSGYVEGFSGIGNSVIVMAQSAKARKGHLKVRYQCPKGPEKHKVMVNVTLLPDPVHGYTTWEKFIDFPATKDWTEIDLGIIDLKEGDNTLKLYSGGGDILVDRFTIEQVD